MSLSLAVDFNSKSVQGFVELSMKPLAPNLKQVVLDSSSIEVNKVTMGAKQLSFEKGEAKGDLGQPILIQLDEPQG